MYKINYIKRIALLRCIHKILFLMRLTTVIILLTMFQLSAAITFGQKLTYNKKNTTINQLFKEIKTQTGYNVVWYEGKLNSQMVIDANYYNTPLEKVMDNVLAGRAVTYEIIGKAIVIKVAEPSFRDKIISFFATIDVRGRVFDENNEPLVGAVVKVKGTNQATSTNSKGDFLLKNVDEKAILIISFLGYETIEITASESSNSIKLITRSDKLNEVEIVSTGYQNIPLERATGSFTLIDNRGFNRNVSSDFLSRLKGITNGLLIDNSNINAGNSSGISIRGRATIFSDTKPLIVVDNFPYEGDLNNLNPNDIENISILKDAAAASIWGARAGNGVIVVTTKNGKLNQQISIGINANLTVGGKPDLYYQPQLTSSQFIDVEQFLFNQGAYTATVNNGYAVISPVISLLNKAKTDPSFAAQVKEEIDAFREFDIRNQLDKYFYRKSTKQQYHLNITGGGPKQSYYFSVGYDKNLPNNIVNSDSRTTLKGSNINSLFNGKLKLTTDITISNTKSESASTTYSPFLPYEQIADINGNALAVLRSGGLRESYTDTAGKGDLLDWKFRPLEELKNNYSVRKRSLTDYRLNFGIDYKIIQGLNISLTYQYYKSNTDINDLNSLESFYTRDLINQFSQINSNTRVVTRPVPLGSIYLPMNGSSVFNYGRTQLDYNRKFKENHSISGIAGVEIRDESTASLSTSFYGYNQGTGTSYPVDFITQFKKYYDFSTGTIGGRNTYDGNFDRYISYYGNASYSYNEKYILSGSYRKDESNLFGVKANQKGVPLWSTGIVWNIYKENFFTIDWFSNLQLKATYGFNGNVNKTVSAYLTASPSSGNTINYYNANFSQIINPPNDELKWERVRNINVGIYFSTRNGRISGSLEYYNKNGIDLIAGSPIAPQTGITTFIGNTANTHTKGWDIQINSNNIEGSFSWNTVNIFNYAADRVTAYKAAVGVNSNLANGFTISPIVGSPINSVFAYKWAGLDALGNPVGYFNGAISSDYTRILNSNDVNQLEFFGSKTPTFFGSMRNTFSYKQVELSFNVIYKFGYFFKAQSLSYSSLFAGGYQQSEYDLRWQQPGDELRTNVPSLIYPSSGSRQSFYSSSSINIEPGDHVRLQDIQFNLNLTKKIYPKLPLTNLNIYCYAANLGIIWKKNSRGLDPENISNYPTPKTIGFGLKTNL
jgi:TonB-linked SusC/RagA family outer membrane protein